jgi:hypothetical protein
MQHHPSTGSRIFSVLNVQYVFFPIVHYVREVTRWRLSSASKLFLIVIYNQINLYEIRNVPFNIQFYITIILLDFP